MVTVCLTCGDRGFVQVMVNCPKCQDSAHHVYCFSVAELLVFTSSVLPEHIQRFQTKLYLWGAFRGKQSSPLTNDNAPRGENDLANPLTCNTQSPVSTLSNNVHCGSESH